MAKPSPRTIPSDDCIITIDTVEYHVHEGESIKVRPVMPVGDLEKLMAFYELASAQKDTDDGIQKLKDATGIFDEACSILSFHILDWNWTDNQGFPIANPYKNPDSIKELAAEEVFYLLNTAMNGGNSVDQKNVDNSLQTT